MNKQLVVSVMVFCSSGKYRWWDEVPRSIYEILCQKKIDFLACYREFLESSSIPEGIRLQITPKMGNNPFYLLRIFSPILRRYDKVIFHLHSFYGVAGFFIFNKHFSRKSRVMMTDHDSWFSDKFSPFKRTVREAFRNIGFLPEVIVGCSRASKNRLSSIYGKNNVTFVYNGTFIQEKFIERNVSCRFKGVFCGRVEAYKGIFTLLRAIALVKDRGYAFHLDVIGEGSDLERAKHLVKDLSIENMVTFHGRVYDIVPYLKQAGIGFVLSEWHENFALTSAEYQALGLVSIYSNSGGLPEQHIEGKTGICVEKKDSEGVADAIIFLLEHPEKWKEMSRMAYENSRNFSIKKMAENYVSLYEDLLEGITNN